MQNTFLSFLVYDLLTCFVPLFASLGAVKSFGFVITGKQNVPMLKRCDKVEGYNEVCGVCVCVCKSHQTFAPLIEGLLSPFNWRHN